MNKRKRKIAALLAGVGPGLFLIGYNIGTGSVTTMAKTGAEYGMELFWALVLSCIFTFVLMVAYGKVTLVSGETILTNLKNELRFGWILALYILFALIIGELLALMSIMGIVVDLLQEAIWLLVGIRDVSRVLIIGVLLTGVYLLLWFGQYKTFEKVLTLFVIFMGLSFIVVFFMISPDYSAIAKGLIPHLPDTQGTFRLVAAIAGTTCSAAVFIMRSTVIKEKGWGIKNLKEEKRDSLVSASMMLFLSGIIMAVAAGTLHVMGLNMDNTVDMIHLFAPIGGNVAVFILILGIVGAGLSTVFPIVLIAPWLIADYTGKPRNIQSKQSRLLILIAMLFAFGTVFIKQRPVALMVFSQAFQAMILPAVAIPILILINKLKMMGKHKATLRENIGIWAVVLFSLVTSWFAITELY